MFYVDCHCPTTTLLLYPGLGQAEFQKNFDLCFGLKGWKLEIIGEFQKNFGEEDVDILGEFWGESLRKKMNRFLGYLMVVLGKRRWNFWRGLKTIFEEEYDKPVENFGELLKEFNIATPTDFSRVRLHLIDLEPVEIRPSKTVIISQIQPLRQIVHPYRPC